MQGQFRMTRRTVVSGRRRCLCEEWSRMEWVWTVRSKGEEIAARRPIVEPRERKGKDGEFPTMNHALAKDFVAQGKEVIQAYHDSLTSLEKWKHLLVSLRLISYVQI